MYDHFRWTNVSVRRNSVTLEYEPLQPFFLLALAERAACGTFVDVGANIGVYSLFASLVSSVERIIAVEANPKTVEELKANIALNGLADRIEVQEKALSSERGQLRFGVISSFSGANSVADTSIHDESSFHKLITVEATTLDKLFGEAVSRPLCIKIDVEGHENEVLTGGKAMLRTNVAIIQVESYDRGDGSTLRILERLGYARLTAIGPDQYFSNLKLFDDPAEVVRVYERAVRQLIAFNHRNKAVMLKRGDFALQLTGRSADVARNLAKRLIGKRL